MAPDYATFVDECGTLKQKYPEVKIFWVKIY